MQRELKLCLILVMILFAQIGISQIHTCGTIGNGNNYSHSQYPLVSSNERSDRTQMTYVKLKIHVGSQPGPGLDAIDVLAVHAALVDLNTRFYSTGIQFIVCGEINIVEDNAAYAINNTDILDSLHEYGYINITVPAVQWLNPGVTGMAFPDHIVISAPYFNSMVLDHELGHVLGLYHTHDTYATAPELVDGSNCLIAGDLICDTPADPDLSLPGMMSANCVYIGTVQDANGQNYSPLPENIMSYASYGCWTSFTQGQIDYMHNVLDNVKIHLQRTSSPVDFNLPVQFCSYDNPYSLTANPAGGVFSGPQVVGSDLVFQPYTTMTYSVNYAPPLNSDTNFIDQYYVNLENLDTANLIWQSFKAEKQGEIVGFDFNIGILSDANYTFKIYSGTGNSGTILYSSTVSLTANTGTSWIHFPVSVPIPTAIGATYTAELSTAGIDFSFFKSFGGSTFFWSYMDGVSFDGYHDLCFREWINGSPPCQDCNRYYTIHQAADATVTNVADYYCTTNDTLVFRGDAAIGEFYMDGVIKPEMNPAVDGIGVHTILYKSNSLGCFDSSYAAFEIVDANQSFIGLPDTAYLSQLPFNIISSGNGGEIKIDNVLNSSFDPLLLGSGMHYVDYLDTTKHDTITYIDQQCFNPNTAYGNWWYKDLHQDSLYFQSFKSNQSGYLDGIALRYLYNFDSLKYEVKLYQGIDTSGLVIFEDTIFIQPFNGYTYPNIFPNAQGIFITDDSSYTFSLKRLSDAYPGVFGQLITQTNNYYPNGNSNILPDPAYSYAVDQDIEFYQSIVQYTGCDIYALDSVFVMSDLAISQNNIHNTAAIFPNPSTDEITITGLDLTNNTTVKIYNVLGELVYVNFNAINFLKIDIASFSDGIYFVELHSENKLDLVKVVKQ